jgi:hypothetical protein
MGQTVIPDPQTVVERASYVLLPHTEHPSQLPHVRGFQVAEASIKHLCPMAFDSYSSSEIANLPFVSLGIQSRPISPGTPNDFCYLPTNKPNLKPTMIEYDDDM